MEAMMLPSGAIGSEPAKLFGVRLESRLDLGRYREVPYPCWVDGEHERALFPLGLQGDPRKLRWPTRTS